MKDDEQILAKQDIKGISGSLRDNSLLLVKNQTNTRFFGYPFTHLAHLYKLGENGIAFGPHIERKSMRLDDEKTIFNKKILKTESEKRKEKLSQKLKRTITRKKEKLEKKKNKSRFVIIRGYDKERAIRKKNKLEKKYDAKISATTKLRKENRLRAKKARKTDKKNKKIDQGNQIMRWGEPLAVYNHNLARISAESIKDYLYSKGYFNAKIEIDTTNYEELGPVGKLGRNLRNSVSRMAGAKYRYVNLDFTVDKGERFYIDSIQYDIKDEALKELIVGNRHKSPLKRNYYDQSTLSEERDFIYDLAVNNGYFDFSKQYIGFQIDSTLLSGDTLVIREVIRNPENRSYHKVFYLDSIVFVSEASISRSVSRTTDYFQDITFSFGRKKYNEKILGWRIPLEQDDRYSRAATIETQRQLSFLDNFKFVNINYDTLGNRFIANIFTSPFSRYETSSEIGLSNTTQGNPGPFATINLKNRNTFNALDIINLSLNAKLQDLRGVSDNLRDADITGIYTSRQFGGQLAMSLPKFFFPLGGYYQRKEELG